MKIQQIGNFVYIFNWHFIYLTVYKVTDIKLKRDYFELTIDSFEGSSEN